VLCKKLGLNQPEIQSPSDQVYEPDVEPDVDDEDYDRALYVRPGGVNHADAR
jgi:hypothetical protein